MSAPMKQSVLFLSRFCVKNSIRPVATNSVKFYSDDNSSDFKRPPVTQHSLSPDGSTILLYHPEQDFPYEHTKPLQRDLSKVGEADSVLKVQYGRDYDTRWREDGPTDHELANIFHETKHRWYYKPGKKYRKPNPPKDRDGL